MKPECLAQIEGFARVERCGRCADLHVTVGPLTFRISENGLERLTGMLEETQARLVVEKFECLPSNNVVQMTPVFGLN